MLIAARFVQGVGGALTSAVILGMIVTMFPQPREQAKALGVYGFVASAGGSIGLLAGGVLTDLISWHWIFLINLPIGVDHRRAGAAADRAAPGHRRRRGRGPPRRGAADRGRDARRLHDPRHHRARLDVGPHARPGRDRRRAARRVRGPPGAHREPADAAAAVPLAQRHRLQPRDGDARRRHVRAVLPRRPVPAAHPRLRAAQVGLAFLPSTLVMGDRLAARVGAADHALRPAARSSSRRCW